MDSYDSEQRRIFVLHFSTSLGEVAHTVLYKLTAAHKEKSLVLLKPSAPNQGQKDPGGTVAWTVGHARGSSVVKHADPRPEQAPSRTRFAPAGRAARAYYAACTVKSEKRNFSALPENCGNVKFRRILDNSYEKSFI